ncbi:MAG TPA: 23S rRNA (guanosine(2251)-2'-O)-methyltransferase RlmB [Firmicutes bacterium]|nr:23S rRNA (guanosine(2251)-2'-O)-methyltransferase RlmB [Bacillota bacterium]
MPARQVAGHTKVGGKWVSRDETIWGRNVVLEALRAGRPFNKILLSPGGRGKEVAAIREEARLRGVPVEEVDRRRLDQLAEGGNHQGVLALAAARAYVEVEDLVARARAAGEAPLLVLLAHVEDPRNLGAAARSAAAAGAHGLIIPGRRAAQVTAAAEKAAAGALEYLPVARVNNLAQCLKELKVAGLWVVGADMEGEQVYFDADLSGPLVVVVGGEDKGLGTLIKRECDFTVRIPLIGPVPSLNVAVAASLLLYEVLRQRRARSSMKS